MKYFIIAVGMYLSIALGACSKVVVVKANPNGKVPPGQMKKATGEKSARNHAPGHQKKQHH